MGSRAYEIDPSAHQLVSPLVSSAARRLFGLPHDHLPRVSHPIDRQLRVVHSGRGFDPAIERPPIPERDVVTTRELDAVEDFTLPTLEDRYRDDLDQNVVDSSGRMLNGIRVAGKKGFGVFSPSVAVGRCGGGWLCCATSGGPTPRVRRRVSNDQRGIRCGALGILM